MSKITKVQKYAVNWLNSLGWDVDTIAKDLNITSKQVSNVLETEPVTQEKVTESKPKNLMITHTSGKQINSVAIMTKEASEVGDVSRNKANTSPSREVKGIFRPKKK